jgi:hypothetical protein
LRSQSRKEPRDFGEAIRRVGSGSGSDGCGLNGFGSDGYCSDGYGSDGYGSDGYASDGYGSKLVVQRNWIIKNVTHFNSFLLFPFNFIKI